MIDKNIVKTAVNEWLAKGDYYLVDLEMTADDRIVIEIDHADGVWIEDCADLSRFLQEKLGEELGDYELEVGSAGIGQPFKVIQQYRNHIGKDVEVLAADGKKYQGVLKSVSDDDAQFVVTVKEKQQVEGKKRPVLVEVDKTFVISEIKSCKYLLILSGPIVCASIIFFVASRFLSDSASSATPEPGNDIFEVEKK